MTYWIRAHNAEGKPFIGDMQGQGVIRHRRPEESPAWQTLMATTRRYPEVKFWTIEDAFGEVIRRVENFHHKPGKL